MKLHNNTQVIYQLIRTLSIYNLYAINEIILNYTNQY